MKKIVCLVLTSLLAAATFTGCANKDAEYMDYSYTSSEAVSSVCVDVRDRAVEVLPSEDGKVHIDGVQSGKERYNVKLSDSGTLTMTIDDNKEWYDHIGTKALSDHRRITLKIPDEMLSSLSVSTTNEDIIVPAPMNIGSVSLDSNGGNISFERLDVKSALSLNAKNGNIGGTIVGGYDDFSISCSVKKGKCDGLPQTKEGGVKKLTVSVNNGDADIKFAG